MASTTSSLVQLAESILAQTKKLDEYLASHKLPQPSFDANGPTTFPASPEEADINAVRHKLIDATKELRDLVTYPSDTLKWMIMTDHTLAASLHAISHFKVAQAVPVTGSIAFADLAKATGLSELNVARFVRRVALARIFAEPQPGHVAHTAASLLLGTDPQMQALVAHMSEEAFPASARIVDALDKFPYSGEPGESPFSLAFGGASFFERKMARPETMQRFAAAMGSWSAGDGSAHMRDCYDWAALPRGATVVDVGGAAGHISLAVAEKFPGLEFVVEDQPPVMEQARALIASSPVGVAKRVQWVAHDFFQPQPDVAKGADVYFMRYILHDWSDAYAKKILRNVVQAMGPESRLVIADAVMPPPGLLPQCQEEVLRSFDVSMLAQLNSQERTLEMWETLLKDSSDGKLGISKVIMPPKGESVSILEVNSSILSAFWTKESISTKFQGLHAMDFEAEALLLRRVDTGSQGLHAMDFEAEALLLRQVDTEIQDLRATDYDAEALLLRQIIFDSPPCAFRQFGKLHLEIRTEIWRLTALNVVRVKEVFNNAKGRTALRRPVPTVLQVCKGSRFDLTYENNVPLAREDPDKYYLLHGEWEKEPHRVYVNWKRDEIYLARPGLWPSISYQPSFRENMRFLVMDWGLQRIWWNNVNSMGGIRMIQQYPRLESVTLLYRFPVSFGEDSEEPKTKSQIRCLKRKRLNELRDVLRRALARELDEHPTWRRVPIYIVENK
ncbi:uncharacterized protein E0L32_009950 [Thyridium curvatum]|uniref:Uncharacterized protein n=1 Tax=Thyridium curvatum TaxID=1093900 RepID=A0A507AUM6_9PEZI|nr:uncharacterized protein E0L32_009950 [Thyridium curvatum]TPX08611.1 hypothetical protein E0L32_009950 [Thyridium curvatum]